MESSSIKLYDDGAQFLIKGIRIAECMNLDDLEDDSSKEESNRFIHTFNELSVSDVLSCSYCSVSFTDATEQRNHYKLDWHRYNLKRALLGNQPIPEEIFSSLTDDISSLSGSGSETSEAEDCDFDVVESKESLPTENYRHRFKTVRHTKAFFENDENQILSVYRCLLHCKKEPLQKENLIYAVHQIVKSPKKWMIVMLGGGHFAAALFDNDTITHHKTFHCYTVRAKQGGSQSSRDNKGGSHPKSAGASLRRYNELALTQHVQEIMSAWSEPLKQCSLILCRATGPFNRGVLFGGKNPPLSKTDQRLRNIPFPTKRPTFKELKRVHDILSSIEVYGSADEFKNKFPKSPSKKPLVSDDATISVQNEKGPKKCEKGNKRETSNSESKTLKTAQREIREDNLPSEEKLKSSSEEEAEIELTWSEQTIDFSRLQEFEDTVPQHVKDVKSRGFLKKKRRKKLNDKDTMKKERKEYLDQLSQIKRNLVESCETGNKESFLECLNIYDTLPSRSSVVEDSANENHAYTVTKEDFIDCLNKPINEENRNTMLHLAASKCLPEFVTSLLKAGADPTVKNKLKLTPYVIAGNKDTRDSFKAFAAEFPGKYDFKNSNIPEPLTEEMEREREEKRKEKKRLKRLKEKTKKQDDKKQRYENEEKQRFLALTDVEKCALTAERNSIKTTNAGKPLKSAVLSRCFQCGTDISQKIPFEYGHNKFCSIPCLKAHRAKTNSYGVEI